MDNKGGLIGIGYNPSSALSEIRQVDINTTEVTTIKRAGFFVYRHLGLLANTL